MKKIISFLFFCIVSLQCLAQNYKKYVGTIGKYPITMFIRESYIKDAQGDISGTKWDGYYFYNKVQKSINLEGTFDAMGMGGMNERAVYYVWEKVNGNETGSFESRSFLGLPNKITGVWRDNRASQSKSYPFYLTRQ